MTCPYYQIKPYAINKILTIIGNQVKCNQSIKLPKMGEIMIKASRIRIRWTPMKYDILQLKVGVVSDLLHHETGH